MQIRILIILLALGSGTIHAGWSAMLKNKKPVMGVIAVGCLIAAIKMAHSADKNLIKALDCFAEELEEHPEVAQKYNELRERYSQPNLLSFAMREFANPVRAKEYLNSSNAAGGYYGIMFLLLCGSYLSVLEAFLPEEEKKEKCRK